uniref:Uncharacterized protein n=1 Tax=viral metagenome TaxID=1070528 RepID=A0A6M3L3N1_9ZZZZ
MTRYEFVVYTWLTRSQINFDFQSTDEGGRMEWGGMDVPFILPDEGIAIRIEPDSAIDRSVIENSGYRVVDVEGIDLEIDLDTVMKKAVAGNEMSPIDSDLYKDIFFASKGFYSHAPSASSNIPPSISTPVVTTGTASNNVINGTLTCDGGQYCKVRFRWGTTTYTDSLLSLIFPWKFYSLINVFSPNISLSFSLATSAFESLTAWQENKITGSTFSQSLATTPSQVYAYKAEAENKDYSVFGNIRTFVGV